MRANQKSGERPGQHPVEEHRPVDETPLPDRGVDAERHPDEDREDHRVRDELHGGRQTLPHVGHHRLRGAKGHAEVPPNHAFDVARVLDVDRLVEPELSAHFLHPFLGRERPGVEKRRLARHLADEKEHDERHEQELHGEQQQASRDVPGEPHASGDRVRPMGAWNSFRRSGRLVPRRSTDDSRRAPKCRGTGANAAAPAGHAGRTRFRLPDLAAPRGEVRSLHCDRKDVSSLVEPIEVDVVVGVPREPLPLRLQRLAPAGVDEEDPRHGLRHPLLDAACPSPGAPARSR